jgi:hypothetical protein
MTFLQSASGSWIQTVGLRVISQLFLPTVPLPLANHCKKLTCSLTLAVSSGNVKISATQAADPAV